MSLPNIAVIITCDSHGRTLEKAVQSVLNQTLLPTELMIVDEGSTDAYTRQVLARLRKDHNVVKTTNRSACAARNFGIRLTAASLIVLVDGDAVLDGTYLSKATAELQADPGMAFVSSGLWYGPSARVWFPPDPDLIEWMTSGTAHMSSMFRRDMWSEIGGFDETLQAYGEIDFWTTALQHGWRGKVLQEALVGYVAAPLCAGQAATRRTGHVSLMERLYRKHAEAITEHAETLLLSKERFILEQKEHQRQLHRRKQDLAAELDALHGEIDQVVQQLRPLGRDRVEFGDLRRTSPISPIWGLDRGIPLDRYYIHAFLDRHRTDIRGRVLEIKDPGYTSWFGDDRVAISDVLDVDPENERATIIADLTRADAVPSDTFDCFLITQTLGVIYDVPSAIAHACRILKPGGVLIATLPAAGRISYEPPALDGDYWRFTEASVRELFAAAFPLDAVEVTGFGNVLACTAFLYGLAPEELSPSELDEFDPFFPVVYGVRAVKPSAAD